MHDTTEDTITEEDWAAAFDQTGAIPDFAAGDHFSITPDAGGPPSVSSMRPLDELPQAQEEDASSSSSSSSLYSSPHGEGSKTRTEAEELGWTDDLIEACRQGLHDPVEVHMPPLPDDAPPLARKVYADFAWVLGLRLAACKDAPVPYACRWVARRVEAWHSSVNGACCYLERVGVLERADDPEFKNFTEGRATNLYLPVGFKPFSGGREP